MKLIVMIPFISYPFHAFFVKKCRTRDNAPKGSFLDRWLDIFLPTLVEFPFRGSHFFIPRFFVCRLADSSFIHSYPVTKRQDSEPACWGGASTRLDRTTNSKSIDWSGLSPRSPQFDRRKRFSKFASALERVLEAWGTLLRCWRASLRGCLWSFQWTWGWIGPSLDTTMNLAVESICVLASEPKLTSVQRAFAELSGFSGWIPFRLRLTHDSLIRIS